MLKRFEMKDFIHFAYLAVIALVLAAVLAALINTSIELINHGLNYTYQKTAFDYYVYLFGIAFIYLSICQPLIKPTHIIQEQPQDPEFLSLPEEVTQVYWLSELLSSPMCHINLSTRGHINSYLATFLEDDSLFDKLPTPDQLSMLRNVLRAESLNSENQSLANNRLVNLMIELKALDIKNN